MHVHLTFVSEEQDQNLIAVASVKPRCMKCDGTQFIESVLTVSNGGKRRVVQCATCGGIVGLCPR